MELLQIRTRRRKREIRKRTRIILRHRMSMKKANTLKWRKKRRKEIKKKVRREEMGEVKGIGVMRKKR